MLSSGFDRSIVFLNQRICSAMLSQACKTVTVSFAVWRVRWYVRLLNNLPCSYAVFFIGAAVFAGKSLLVYGHVMASLLHCYTISPDVA